MRKSILPASIMAFAAVATAQDAYNDPQTVAWREICDNNYYWGLGIETPWDPVTRLGIDLSNVVCADLAKDWDVYNRRISSTDVALAKSGATATSGANVYFTLYNRRAGVLRTFIWLDAAQDAPGTYYSARLNIQDGGSNKILDHSLLAYEGGSSAHSVIQRTDATKNTEKIYFTDRHVNNRWLIEDTHLSFDMNGAHSQALYFDYLVSSHTTGNIKLTGTIGQEGQNAAGLGIMSSAINTFKSAGEGYNAGTSGTKAASEVAKSVGEKLKALGGNGQFLIDLGTKTAGLTGGVGAIFAGSEFIKGFLGWAGGGQVGMAPSVVSLSGTLSYVQTTTNPRIPLANANFITSQQALFAKTYPTAGDKNLGLYVLNATPDVKFWYTTSGPYATNTSCPYYTRQYYVSIADPTCGLYINPASGAKLKEVKLRPEIIIPNRSISHPNWRYCGNAIIPETKYNPDLQAPSYWNRIAVGGPRKIFKNTDGSFSSLDNIQVKLKISFVFDIGRNENMESANTYTPANVSYVSSVSGTRDYNTCSQPDFIRQALEQNAADSWIISDIAGPNWYALYGGAPGAINGTATVSGRIGDNQTSTLHTGVKNCSGATFRWKVSSEPNYDFLMVYVDGQAKGSISGFADWSTFNLSFPYGNHTISWQYFKDGSLQAGEDRGMVDQVILR